MTRLLSIIAAIMIALLPALARAGSSEATAPILPAAQVTAFAAQVERELADRGAHVAIVARTGRDPDVLPDGIDYTHVAYWVYSHQTRADGSTFYGYRVYNLYQDNERLTRSRLVQDTPADFFAGAWKLDAGIIVPDRRLQEKILKVIASPTYARLHNANYSVLANPRTAQFQNCTEHTLDVLMAGLYGTSDRTQIKANIAAYFEPQTVKIDGLKRMLAPVASGALTTSDHGRVVGTATFGSIARFMQKNDLADAVIRLTPR